MTTKAGVWIDHEQALVILITDAGTQVKKIAFERRQPVPPKASSRTKRKYTPNDFIAEDRQQRKVESNRKDYYDEVIAAIHDAVEILILGPGEAKVEFHKRMQAKKLRGVRFELATADKMTDRQLAARVGEHFSTAPPTQVAVPKTTAVKKTGRATAGKRAKKVRK